MLHHTLEHHAHTRMVINVLTALLQLEHVVLNVGFGSDRCELQALLNNRETPLREVSDGIFAPFQVVYNLEREFRAWHSELGRHLVSVHA